MRKNLAEINNTIGLTRLGTNLVTFFVLIGFTLSILPLPPLTAKPPTRNQNIVNFGPNNFENSQLYDIILQLQQLKDRFLLQNDLVDDEKVILDMQKASELVTIFSQNTQLPDATITASIKNLIPPQKKKKLSIAFAHSKVFFPSHSVFYRSLSLPPPEPPPQAIFLIC